MATNYRKLINDGMCAVCKKPLGTIFNRIRVDTGVINARAAQRHFGLVNYFEGSVGLADVFSPDADRLVKFTADVDVEAVQMICVHQSCLADGPIDLAILLEAARESAKETT